MKLNTSQLWNTLLKPAQISHMCLYGPEAGLLENVARDFAYSWSQMFHKSVFVHNDPHVEALNTSRQTQVSLFGSSTPQTGIHVIFRGTDKDLSILQGLWETDPKTNTYIVVGEGLNTKSKLVTAGNNHQQVGCAGVYEGSPAWRARWIQQGLAQQNATLTPELQKHLVQYTDDTTHFPSLMEKVVLLQPCTAQELQPLLETHPHKIEELVWAFYERSPHFRTNLGVFIEQFPDDQIKFLRILLQTGMRLHQVSCHYAVHKNLEAALSTLTPALHFKIKEPFTRTVMKRGAENLWSILGRINHVELQHKQFGLSLVNLL